MFNIYYDGKGWVRLGYCLVAAKQLCHTERMGQISGGHTERMGQISGGHIL